MLVFGTRPETIKMAPIIKAIEKRSERFEAIVVVTAQHREILDQPLQLFGVTPQFDLNIMTKGQSLFDVSAKALKGLEGILKEINPHIVLVQGDTTTTFIGSLAAFYMKIPVGHVEAGLRTYNKYNPFPEEINRQLTGGMADFHFVPTPMAQACLLREGVDAKKVFLTGNTVIDALHMILKAECKFKDERLQKLDFENKKVILLTTHRRESFGQPIENVMRSIEVLSKMRDDVVIVFPIHFNPNVREAAKKILKNFDQILLIEPLDYQQFVHLMARSYLILTDSGGIQEEATSLGKPTLILRETTERMEGVLAGTTKLVGTQLAKIVQEAISLLNDENLYQRMAQSNNLYGDGTTSVQILDILDANADKLIPLKTKIEKHKGMNRMAEFSQVSWERRLKNILTVNVEDLGIFSAEEIIIDIFKTLEILHEFDIRATFFVLGWIAEKYPEVIQAIKDYGHEISAQGYSNKLVYTQTQDAFREELLQTLDILQSITNETVLGFRAPSYSIIRDCMWAWDVLMELGLSYDSSVFPVKHDTYGIPSAPRFPFIVNLSDQGGLIEYPPSTIKVFGENIPISGGGYLRYYPYWFVKKGILDINSIGKPAIIYLRTWELNPKSFEKGNKFLGVFRKRGNYDVMFHRISNLLKDFDFVTIRETLGVC